MNTTNDGDGVSSIGAFPDDLPRVHALKRKMGVTTQPEVLRKLLNFYERHNGRSTRGV